MVTPRRSARAGSVHAVIVASDGDDLAATVAAIAAQTRRPDQVTIVLVGARAERAEQIGMELRRALHGEGNVVSIAAAKNFGDAIRQAMTSEPLAEPTGWYWFLHDDSAPEPAALQELVAESTRGGTVALVGPKQVGWDDPTQVLEVGLEVTRSGRRADLTAPEEIDQGQYDGRHDVLAVGTAGMLVSAPVWEETRGLDPHLGPFGDGLEYGRRLRLAGYRVVVAPKAVVRHRQQSLDRSRGGAASFQARREAQLYNWLLTVPFLWLPFLLVGLAPWTLVRSLGRLVARQPRLAGAELGAYLQLLAALPALGRARRRLRKSSTIPQSALTGLELSRRELRERKKRHRRIRRSRLGDHEQVSRAAAEVWSGYRRNLRLSFFGLVAVAALLAIIAWYPYFAGVAGSAWADLPPSAAALWEQVRTPWVFAGSGAPGPVNPILFPFAALAVPLGLLGVEPTQAALAVMVLAAPLASIGGWLVARLLTRSTALSVAAGALWGFHPGLLFALVYGNLSAAVAWVAVPFVLVGLWRATKTLPPLAITAVEDVYLLPRPNPLVGGGIAAAALLLVAAASPGLVLVAIPVAYLLALAPDRSVRAEFPAGARFVSPAGAPLELTSGRPPRSKRLLAATLAWVPAAVLVLPSLTWSALHLYQPRTALSALFNPTGIVLEGAPDAGTLLTGVPLGPEAWLLWGLVAAALPLWGALALVITTWRAGTRPWLARSFFLGGTVLVAAAAVLAWFNVGAVPWLAGLVAAATLAWLVAGLSSSRSLPRTAEVARGAFWRRQLPGVALAATGLAGAIGIWFLGPFNNPEDPQTVVATGGYGAPLIAKQAAQSERLGRLLVLEGEGEEVQAALWRDASRSQSDLSLGLRNADSSAYDLAQETLAEAVGTLAAHPSSAPAQALAAHDVELILVPLTEPLGPGSVAANIDSSVGYERIGTTEVGTMWRVRPDGTLPAWAKMHQGAGPNHQETVIAAGPVGVNTTVEVTTPGTLVLAESANPGWKATFAGQNLGAVDDPDPQQGWRQAFAVPEGAGRLTVTYQPVWTWWWLGASAATAAAALIAVIPWRRRKVLWAVHANPPEPPEAEEPPKDGVSEANSLLGPDQAWALTQLDAPWQPEGLAQPETLTLDVPRDGGAEGEAEDEEE